MRKTLKIAAALLAISAIGCGGGAGESQFSTGGGFGGSSGGNLGGGSSGGGNGSGGDPRDVQGDQQTYMDCNNLEPNKIYMLARLSILGGFNFVLADPQNITRFCPAFSQDDAYTNPTAISATGTLLYSRELGVSELVPEPLLLERRGSSSYQRWYYPDNAAENDVEIFSLPEDSVKFIEDFEPFDSAEGLEYFYIYRGWVRLFDGMEHRDIYDFDTALDHKILAVLPDGRALIGVSERMAESSLFLLDKNGVREEIQYPEGGGFYFPAKARGNSGAENALWILAVNEADGTGETQAFRWSFDINSLVITVDGQYSRLPEQGYELGRDITDAALTTDGKLWTVHFYRQPAETVPEGGIPEEDRQLFERDLIAGEESPFRIVLNKDNYTLEEDWDSVEVIQTTPIVYGFVTGR